MSIALLRHIQSESTGHAQSLRMGYANHNQQPANTSNEDTVYANPKHNDNYKEFRCDDEGTDIDLDDSCSMCPACDSSCKPNIHFS
jgi:hypothetical protein